MSEPDLFWVDRQLERTGDGQRAITWEYHFGLTHRFGTETYTQQWQTLFRFVLAAGVFCDVPAIDVYELDA